MARHRSDRPQSTKTVRRHCFCVFVDPRGVEPRPIPCHGIVLPLYYGPISLFTGGINVPCARNLFEPHDHLSRLRMCADVVEGSCETDDVEEVTLVSRDVDAAMMADVGTAGRSIDASVPVRVISEESWLGFAEVEITLTVRETLAESPPLSITE